MKRVHSISLLAVLILFFVVAPFVREQRPVGAILAQLLFTALLLGMVYGVSYSRGALLLGCALAAPALVLGWVGTAMDSDGVRTAGGFFTFGTLGLATWLALRDLMRRKSVTAETLREAVVVYLLLGVAWSVLFAIVLHFDRTALAGVSVASLHEMLYFSFTTLTTLGYGDITPASPFTQSLATLEALAGQIFMTVLVARLVGLYIAQKQA